MLGWCVALGGTTALDTLGSQAFTGGIRPTELSVHFQRCLLLLWILFIPVAFLWAFIEPALLALGQPEELSTDVQRFLRVLIVGAPGYIGFESLKKYLQCQGMHRESLCSANGSVFGLSGIMGASTIVLAVLSPVNVVLNIGFIHYTSLGLLGSPVALSIIYWLSFIFLGFFTYFSPTHTRNGTWGGLCFGSVFNLRSCYLFLKLALPGILMVGTEWLVL